VGFRNSSILLSVCSEFPERVWKADIKHRRRKRKSCKWFGHFYSTHYCFYSVFVIIKSHVNMSVFRRVAVKELLYKCWVKTTEPSSTVKQIIRDVNETFSFETETRPFQISPRPRQDWDLQLASRETETETFWDPDQAFGFKLLQMMHYVSHENNK